MKIRHLIAAAAASTAALATALPASAAVAAGPTAAYTVLTNRLDSGGNGYWAVDGPVFRVLTITDRGPDHIPARGEDYTATVSDRGAFSTIPGAFTPNQGGPYHGHHILGQVYGTLTGGASYTFTATKPPNMGLVPFTESGTPTSGPRTTSRWFEQAFPAGTVFTGGINNNWSWTYKTGGCFLSAGQTWTDAAANGGGQAFGAGNIDGTC